jgi:hypothetical protein
MPGYREHSFDPNAYSEAGRPMRPYNWVQWTGVALILVSLAMNLAYLARDFGWLPFAPRIPSIAFAPLILGIVLVNSRRHPATDPAPELAAQRRRWLIVIVAICAVILGAALVIDFKGA